MNKHNSWYYINTSVILCLSSITAPLLQDFSPCLLVAHFVQFNSTPTLKTNFPLQSSPSTDLLTFSALHLPQHHGYCCQETKNIIVASLILLELRVFSNKKFTWGNLESQISKNNNATLDILKMKYLATTYFDYKKIVKIDNPYRCT